MKTRMLFKFGSLVLVSTILSSLGNAQKVTSQRDTCYRVSGAVLYKTLTWGVSGVTVSLSPGWSMADSNGTFLFPCVPPGSYILNGAKSGGWGGVNSTDALLVARFFVGLTQLDSLSQLAADVDNNGVANAADALLICRRAAGLGIPGHQPFRRGDWVFWPTRVTVINSDVWVILLGLCVGDVNGSFVPTEP